MVYDNYLFLIIFVCQVVLAAATTCRTTLVVDQSGKGHFKSIQSAIDHIPTPNRNWVCIQVNAGIYREKVKIGKSFIMLKGAGISQTKVVLSRTAGALNDMATLEIVADNVVATNIAFVNGYNYPWTGQKVRVPAPAAYIGGDKVAFYNCGFYGVQDTLCDAHGRHFFSKCLIVGAVDFIFGAGQSVYEDSTIHVLGDAIKSGVYGFITANKRDSPNSPSWFIFNRCKIVGEGMAYLGRPWRPYARVLFYQTYMSDVVHPKGWAHWIGHGTEHSSFSEYQCEGPGSDQSQRVQWRVEIHGANAKKLPGRSYIDSDAWIENQPK